MICLALDTAGPACAVALARRNGGAVRVIGRSSERLERGHAERLMPMVGEALRAAGLAYADIGRVAVTIGPGSFTGVRAGVAAARGLALALGVEAFGIGVLDALLHAAGREEAALDDSAAPLLVAALDARRGEIYALARQSGRDVVPACLTDPEALARELAGAASAVLLAGSAARLLAEALAGRGIEARVLHEADCADIEAVAELGAAGIGESPPRPLYLRPPDAKPQKKPTILMNQMVNQQNTAFLSITGDSEGRE